MHPKYLAGLVNVMAFFQGAASAIPKNGQENSNGFGELLLPPDITPTSLWHQPENSFGIITPTPTTVTFNPTTTAVDSTITPPPTLNKRQLPPNVSFTTEGAEEVWRSTDGAGQVATWRIAPPQTVTEAGINTVYQATQFDYVPLTADPSHFAIGPDGRINPTDATMPPIPTAVPTTVPATTTSTSTSPSTTSASSSSSDSSSVSSSTSSRTTTSPSSTGSSTAAPTATASATPSAVAGRGRVGKVTGDLDRKIIDSTYRTGFIDSKVIKDLVLIDHLPDLSGAADTFTEAFKALPHPEGGLLNENTTAIFLRPTILNGTDHHEEELWHNVTAAHLDNLFLPVKNHLEQLLPGVNVTIEHEPHLQSALEHLEAHQSDIQLALVSNDHGTSKSNYTSTGHESGVLSFRLDTTLQDIYSTLGMALVFGKDGRSEEVQEVRKALLFNDDYSADGQAITIVMREGLNGTKSILTPEQAYRPSGFVEEEEVGHGEEAGHGEPEEHGETHATSTADAHPTSTATDSHATSTADPHAVEEHDAFLNVTLGDDRTMPFNRETLTGEKTRQGNFQLGSILPYHPEFDPDLNFGRMQGALIRTRDNTTDPIAGQPKPFGNLDDAFFLQCKFPHEHRHDAKIDANHDALDRRLHSINADYLQSHVDLRMEDTARTIYSVGSGVAFNEILKVVGMTAVLAATTARSTGENVGSYAVPIVAGLAQAGWNNHASGIALSMVLSPLVTMDIPVGPGRDRTMYPLFGHIAQTLIAAPYGPGGIPQFFDHLNDINNKTRTKKSMLIPLGTSLGVQVLFAVGIRLAMIKNPALRKRYLEATKKVFSRWRTPENSIVKAEALVVNTVRRGAATVMGDPYLPLESEREYTNRLRREGTVDPRDLGRGPVGSGGTEMLSIEAAPHGALSASGATGVFHSSTFDGEDLEEGRTPQKTTGWFESANRALAKGTDREETTRTTRITRTTGSTSDSFRSDEVIRTRDDEIPAPPEHRYGTDTDLNVGGSRGIAAGTSFFAPKTTGIEGHKRDGSLDIEEFHRQEMSPEMGGGKQKNVIRTSGDSYTYAAPKGPPQATQSSGFFARVKRDGFGAFSRSSSSRTVQVRGPLRQYANPDLTGEIKPKVRTMDLEEAQRLDAAKRTRQLGDDHGSVDLSSPAAAAHLSGLSGGSDDVYGLGLSNTDELAPGGLRPPPSKALFGQKSSTFVAPTQLQSQSFDLPVPAAITRVTDGPRSEQEMPHSEYVLESAPKLNAENAYEIKLAPLSDRRRPVDLTSPEASSTVKRSDSNGSQAPRKKETITIPAAVYDQNRFDQLNLQGGDRFTVSNTGGKLGINKVTKGKAANLQMERERKKSIDSESSETSSKRGGIKK